MPVLLQAATPAPDPAAAPASRDAAGPVRLAVRGLTKVFAPDPRPALAMLARGAGKDEVQRRLGAVVGVDQATFEIRAGEIFVIMGLSGSGKSTIVRLLNRLIEPSAGEILLDGRDLARLSRRDLIAVRRRDMSMVFQSFALMPHMTALDNAAFGLEMAGAPKAARREAAMRALAQVGLAAYAHSYPRALSGGQQQRVGLARALANDPTIMLMDEAFSALDPLIRTEMQDELLRLQRERKRTIVFISHDPDEAMRIGDRIAVMRHGRIVQVGRPRDIVRAPADDYVRAFFRSVNVARVLRAGDVARFEPAAVILDVPGEVGPALRRLEEAGRDWGYVCDGARRFQGVVSCASLRHALALAEPRFEHAFLPGLEPIAADAPVHGILRSVAAAACPVPVVDAEGRHLGAISRAGLLEALDRSD